MEQEKEELQDPNSFGFEFGSEKMAEIFAPDYSLKNDLEDKQIVNGVALLRYKLDDNQNEFEDMRFEFVNQT